MFIHYPNRTHRISNVSSGFIFRGVIFVWIFGIVYRRPLFGGLIFGIYGILLHYRNGNELDRLKQYPQDMQDVNRRPMPRCKSLSICI